MKKIFVILFLMFSFVFYTSPVYAATDRLVVKYNEQNSNENMLSIDIYLKNPGNFATECYESIYIILALYDGNNDVTSQYFSSATTQVSLSGGSNYNVCRLNSSNKRININYYNTPGASNYIRWDGETGHIATFNITLSKSIDKELTFKATNASYKRVRDGEKVNIQNQEFDKIYPYSQTSSSSYLIDIGETLTNQNNQLISTADLSSLTEVNFDVLKSTDSNVNASFVIAFYNSNNTLEFAEITTKLIDNNSDSVKVILSKSPETANAIKIFAWEDFVTLTPLSEVLEYNITD